jgi:hypothetical protein
LIRKCDNEVAEEASSKALLDFNSRQNQQLSNKTVVSEGLVNGHQMIGSQPLDISNRRVKGNKNLMM